MAAMFYRNQPVSEIKKMEYHEMKFWYEIHELIGKEWVKAQSQNQVKK